MSRKGGRIKAIPTTYNHVKFRSRLEARWAAFLDALQWTWEYEPDLQAGFVIPDFVITDFAHPCIIECKPEVTVKDLAIARRALIGKMPAWLRDDVIREIHELDLDAEAPIELTDQALQDLYRVDCGENPHGRSRRTLVVGPALHIVEGRVTLDGDYGLTLCCENGTPSHVGLATDIGVPCLRCGQEVTAWMPEDIVLEHWRESQNSAQWRPV